MNLSRPGLSPPPAPLLPSLSKLLPVGFPPQVTSSPVCMDMSGVSAPTEFLSRHSADGTITFVDPRCISVIGYQPQVGRPEPAAVGKDAVYARHAHRLYWTCSTNLLPPARMQHCPSTARTAVLLPWTFTLNSLPGHCLPSFP